MDIRKFAVVTTNRLHLRSANDELMYAEGADGAPDLTKPLLVHLHGPGSREYAAAQSAQQNRMVDVLKRRGKTKQSAEDSAAEHAEFLAACTASMENVEYDGLEGDALHRAVYVDRSIGFVAEQVARFLGDWGNFTTGSTKP